MFKIYTYKEKCYPFTEANYQIVREPKSERLNIHFIDHKLDRIFRKRFINSFNTENEIHQLVEYFTCNLHNLWSE